MRLDLGWSDLAFGMLQCLNAADRTRVSQDLAFFWPEPETVVPCLSVRSGFDLVLSSTDWPPGSEVLMSGITIPQMATIIRGHGLKPVAIDVDPDTLLIDPAAVGRAITPRTRALVYTSLFGSRPDLTPVIEVSHDAGLLVVEDRAQAFAGAPEPLGDADIAMYSFGTIKTATSLGGAILLIRDGHLRKAVIDRQADYPTQSSSQYLLKLLKGWLMVGLGRPGMFAAFTNLTNLAGLDYDPAIRSLSRTFKDADLLDRIRRQPCTALLALMRRRFTNYDRHRVERRQSRGERYASLLSAHVKLLGGHSPHHTHWLFPVLSADPLALVAAGRDAGYDLTTGTSILAALDPGCPKATRAMQQVVYLPLDPASNEAEMDRLITVVINAETAARATSNQELCPVESRSGVLSRTAGSARIGE